MTEKVYGVGVNDIQVRDDAYFTWVNMLSRCYDPKYLAKKPSYIGCAVAPEWLQFSNFREWMLRQPWQGNHLDKDILFPGNKMYSPETCVFVDRKTNNLLTDGARRRGEHPLGVTYHKRRKSFMAGIKRDSKSVHLGYFSNPMDAHGAWQREKAKIIRENAAHQGDWRIAVALFGRAKQLDNDRLLGVETIKL